MVTHPLLSLNGCHDNARMCCHVTSLMLACTAVLYLDVDYVRCMAECAAEIAIGDAKRAQHMCSISLLIPRDRCTTETLKTPCVCDKV